MSYINKINMKKSNYLQDDDDNANIFPFELKCKCIIKKKQNITIYKKTLTINLF